MTRPISPKLCCLLLVALAAAAAMRSAVDNSQYQLLVTSEDGSLIQAGLPTILCLDVTGVSGHSLLHPLHLRQLHSRLLHIVFLPATYSSVLHVHLEDYPALYHAYLTSKHCAAVNVTLPSAGRWVVGVNLWPTHSRSVITTSAVIDVVGSTAATPMVDFPIDTRSRQLVQPLPLQHGQRYTAAVQRSTLVEPNNRTVLIDVQLDGNKRPVTAGVCCPLALSVSTAEGGERVDDLLPLLTLPAHLFLFYFNSSTNEYHFHHMHAHNSHHPSPASCSTDRMDEMAGMEGMLHVDGVDSAERQDAAERFGPIVWTAGVQFDCPGRWMVIGQLRRAGAGDTTSDGDLLTVSMDVIAE